MEDRVEEILHELVDHRRRLNVPSTPSPEFGRAWPGLLLVHRVRGGGLGDAQAALDRGVVVLDAPSSKASRAKIGTDLCVFCSVAVAPYWEPPMVLLFGPISEARLEQRRLSAPWDTKGAVRQGNEKGLSPKDLVERYSLPAHADEQYLPTHLATCFGSLSDFLDGLRPVRVDPAGVFSHLVEKSPPGDWCWLHTPESRFENGVTIAGDLLRAVFVDSEALTTDEQRLTATVLQRLVQRADGVYRPLQRSAGAVDYRLEVSMFIKGWLREQNWWQ